MSYSNEMKTISIRDLRRKWPEAEATLQVEPEILVTRNGKPVARLVRITPQKPAKARWNPEAHLRWLTQTWGHKKAGLTDKYLTTDRDAPGRKV
jgi:antitoxin (DNA-binding transcriptional repressor) of toxin-antitoxin stability system